MVKECRCICKEEKGPKEWKSLTKFRIAELDVLRGLPGYTDITFFMAKDEDDAIEKYYKQNPNASNRILVYPEGCANIYTRPKTFPVRPLKEPRIHGAARLSAGLKKAGVY